MKMKNKGILVDATELLKEAEGVIPSAEPHPISISTSKNDNTVRNQRKIARNV